MPEYYQTIKEFIHQYYNHIDDMIPNKYKEFIPTVFIGLISIIFIYSMHFNGVFDSFELKIIDFKFNMRGPLSGDDALSAWPNSESYEDVNENAQFDKGTDIFRSTGIGCWEEEICGNKVFDEGENFQDLNQNNIWDKNEPFTDSDQCELEGKICHNSECVEIEECHDINNNGIVDNGLDVVIVEIDDESFRLINEPMPYSRGTVWKNAIKNLSLAGAKVIGLDLMFDKPDHQTQNIKNYAIENDVDIAVKDGDVNLVEAIKFAEQLGTKVVLSSKIAHEPTSFPPYYWLDPTDLIKDQISGQIDMYIDIDGFFRRYPIYVELPTPGTKKRFSFGVQAALQFTNSSNKSKLIPDVINKKYNVGPFVFDSYGFGSLNTNTFLIDFYGPTSSEFSTFKRYPLSSILDTKEYVIGKATYDPDWDEWTYLEDNNWMDNYIDKESFFYQIFYDKNPFRGKVVLIGNSLKENQDLHPTPYYNYNGNVYLMPGVEVHANAVQQILHNNTINIPIGPIEFEYNDSNGKLVHIFIIILMTILTLLALGKAEPLSGFLIVGGALFLWFNINVGLFTGDYFWLFKYAASMIIDYNYANYLVLNNSTLVPLIFPAISIVVPFGLNLSYRLYTEGQDKQFLKNTFGSYISAEMVDQMFESKEVPELGGKKGYHTLIFSDVASFSSFSEQLTESQLVELLNEYLTGMTDIILKNKGTVDKYIGDAIMAFYGAPVDLEDHEYRAVFTVNEMNKKLEELKEKWRNEGDKWPDLVRNMEHRVGINTGELVTGNMGSELQMNYTCMGDTVNLAARLESGSKQWGVYTQVAKSVYDKTKNKFVFRKLSKIRVKGRKEPVVTYELLCAKGEEPQGLNVLLEKFEIARKLYENQEWDKAIEAFSISDKLEDMSGNRHTNPSRRYIEICNEYKNNSPGKDWDGVYTQTQK